MASAAGARMTGAGGTSRGCFAISKKSKMDDAETCVDCGLPTFHHLAGREDGVPLCRVCEYKRGVIARSVVGVEEGAK
jgi:hypothetical protein